MRLPNVNSSFLDEFLIVAISRDLETLCDLFLYESEMMLKGEGTSARFLDLVGNPRSELQSRPNVLKLQVPSATDVPYGFPLRMSDYG